VSSKNDLLRRQRRWADARGLRYDARGRLLALAELLRGSELASRVGAPPRIQSLTSSAALVVNVFGYWRERALGPLVAALGLGDAEGARLTFEEPLPTGLEGDPPLADVGLRWPGGRVVAIESKFAEWLVRRPRNQRVLKDKYFAGGVSVWAEAGLPRCQALAEDLQAGRERSKFLHVAQLLKHALGLAKRGERRPALVYLYYDWSGPEAPVHRDEIERVQTRLAGELDWRVLTYQELYRALCAVPGVERAYLDYLAQRYFGH
jgi:hypothetical protein